MTEQLAEKKTIKWIKAYDDNKNWIGILKFTDSDDIVNIDESLQENIDKLNLKENSEVEVVLEEDILKSIKLINSVKKGEDTVSDVKTVQGISTKNKGILFAEDKEENKWYTLSDAAFQFMTKAGIKRGTKVTFSAEKGKGRNETITKITPVKTDNYKSSESKNDFDGGADTKTETKTSWTPRKDTDSVQKSIEAQASVNSANQTIARIYSLSDDAVNPEQIKSAISSLARHNFDLIQELKNK